MMELLLVVTALLPVVAPLSVRLEPISTLYLPYRYSPAGQYDLIQNAAEQCSYDAANKLLYSVGNSNIHVIDMEDVSNMTVLFHTSLDGAEITDVEICGDFVFVAVDNLEEREEGQLLVYNKYNKSGQSFQRLHSIPVGALPDMIHPTADCRRVVVAVEAEAYVTGNGTLVDPEGGVGIVTFSGSPAGNYTYKTLDFREYNSRVSQMQEEGVRFVYREGGNTFSNDVEPEYIAFNKEETVAYIALQENNAVAVVDMETEEIVRVHGLGFKQWDLSSLDVSDKDDSIAIRSWPVFGMYQPDSLKVIRINGQDYVITANEGDSKDYSSWSEEARVKDLNLSSNFESNATRRAWLQEDSSLGRLKVTTRNGRNESGEFDQLFSFGARSFSIWHAGTMELVYDSGNDVERQISLGKSNIFNSNVNKGVVVVTEMDSRSDDKGPECESLAVTQHGHYTLIMLGSERPGIISVYSIDHRKPGIQPRFETMIDGVTRADTTWDVLYQNKTLTLADPEDLHYIPAEDSPIGEPILIASASVSGSVTVLRVKLNTTEEEDADPNESSGAMHNLPGAPIMTIGFLLLTVILAETAASP